MKMTTFKKFLGLGMMLAAFAIAGAVPASAQGCDDTEGHAALYGQILTKAEENNKEAQRTKKGNPVILKALVGLSKDYLQKYGECDKKIKSTDADGKETETDHPFAPNVKWVKTNAQIWEGADKTAAIEVVYAKYADELKASKWDEAIATSKELLKVFPADKSLNIYIPLASIGLYESYKGNDKYVDLSIQNAKIALDKIKAGEASLNNSYGINPYGYGNKDDAASELKFILGYLTYEKKNDKKAGVAYLYDVANSPGRNKTEPRAYVALAMYALEQAKPVAAELTALSTKLNEADAEIRKPETTEERKKELSQLKIDLDKQITDKELYLKAWEERALDGYSRAYKIAKDSTAADKEYRQKLYNRITDIYKSRFGKPDGIDSYIASAVAKPIPNPTTDVTPVAAPAAETTGGASAVVAKPKK